MLALIPLVPSEFAIAQNIPGDCPAVARGPIENIVELGLRFQPETAPNLSDIRIGRCLGMVEVRNVFEPYLADEFPHLRPGCEACLCRARR